MHQFLTFLISMLPVIELKGAIPIAILEYGLPWWQAYIFGVLGSIFSAFLILLLLGVVSEWLSKNFAIFKKFFTWLFDRTRSKHAKKFEKYEELLLLIISAIPLPILGGVWTAALIAFIFGVKTKNAMIFITIGTIIAGIIFVLGTLGLGNIF